MREDRERRDRDTGKQFSFISRARGSPPLPIALIFHQVHLVFIIFFYASVEIEFCV